MSHLDIEHANVGVMRGDPATWPLAGHLLLDGLSYKRLTDCRTDARYRLEWLRLQPLSSGLSKQSYRHLAEVLSEQGNDRAAEEILIGLEDDRRMYSGQTSAQKMWSFIFKWMFEYGYRPLRRLWYINVFILLGFLVFGSAYQSGHIVPSEKESYESFKAGHLPGSYEAFCALVYSFDTFVPIIDLGQKSQWTIDTEDEVLKSPKRSESNKLACAICDPMALTRWRLQLPSWFIRFYRWMDIVVGWFFTVFITTSGISGLAQRD